MSRLFNEKLADLRITDVNIGEWWEILDSEDPSLSHYVEIVDVDLTSTIESKIITAKVILESAKHEKETVITFKMSMAGSPILGRMVKEKDESTTDLASKIDPTVYRKGLAFEVIQLLRASKDTRYTLEMSAVIEYLKRQEFFKEKKSAGEAKKIVIESCKEYAPGAIKFHGRYVQLVNLRAFDPTKVTVQAPQNNQQSVRKVDLDKLMAGIRSIIESGILGDIIIE